MNFEQIIFPAQIRYFSLARHALVAALRLLKLPAGTSVLLPEFICRDVLGAVHEAGGLPVFYSVNQHLVPAHSPEQWPIAKVVLAVNYFGFAQDLQPFQDYCQANGAHLIEDNAHGLLSADDQGTLLGLRSEIGIFSLRKTLAMPDGAALVVKEDTLIKMLPSQLTFVRAQGGFNFRIKQALRKIPGIGNRIQGGAVQVLRVWRKLRTGSEIPISNDAVEIQVPGNPAPHEGLLEKLKQLRQEEEKQRRRELFFKVAESLKITGITPVYPELGDNTVPYGYPFYANQEVAAKARVALRALNLECFLWPELPKALVDSVSEYYRQLWLVNFIH